MLLVKTFLAQSLIDGFGVFADQLIPAGTPVWSFDPRIDLMIDVDPLWTALSQAVKEYFDKYAYLDIRLRQICGLRRRRAVRQSLQPTKFSRRSIRLDKITA